MNPRKACLPGDSPVLESLIADIELLDGHPALGERKYLNLADPPQSGGSATQGWLVEEDCEVFAFLAIVEEGSGLFTVEIVTRPTRRQGRAVDGLLEMAVAVAADAGAEKIRLWTYVPELMQASERAGFELERELFHMKLPLPLAQSPRFPAGIRVRGFREGLDETRWLEANNQVFSGHPENGNWGLADLDRRRRRHWFSAPGLRMAWDGEKLAGFCWTKTPSSAAGEIYVIGVLPDYQGMGLGKALLLEGIDHMHTIQHARACVLYVDSSNTAALNMYQNMGFRHHHTDRSYRLCAEHRHSTH